MSPRRRCLGCGILTENGSRCLACSSAAKAIRNAHAGAAAQVVADWRALHGDWCPGFERDGHPSQDLTADHSTPITRGGVPDGVYCRGCNSRKGAR